MRNTDLINRSTCEIIPCQLSIQDFSKSNGCELESWEYETILKQRMDWNDNSWTKIVDIDNAELAEILNAPKTGFVWEDDVIIDKDQLRTSSQHCLHELALDIAKSSVPLFYENDERNAVIKHAKTSRRKTVLDLYPVDVEQNRYFLDLDRRCFPFIFVPTLDERGISENLRSLSSGFHSISNGDLEYFSSQLNDISFNRSRLFLYETSEQHSPFRMQRQLTSLAVAYSSDARNLRSLLGVPRQVRRRSPFYGALSDAAPYQLALENPFFRVPVYEHITRSTDFLLVLDAKLALSLRSLDGVLLAGKQMPLVRIHNPSSNFFRRMTMKVVVQLFFEMSVVPVDVLASVLSNVDFLNLETELQKIATLNHSKKHWRLKVPLGDLDGFYSDLQVEDYMVWSAIISYLNDYEFVQPDKNRNKKTQRTETSKKKFQKNPCSPWSVSKAYLNGVHKGFWKLENFEEPTRRNQMDSFTFVNTLVPKRMINEKTDLRKLTVHEANRLLKKFRVIDYNKKKMKRWALVNHLSTHAATDLGGNVDMEKYARETKANRRNIRLKYIQQCQSSFESSRAILSNPNEPESETETTEEILKAETKDINIVKDIDDFRKFLEEGNSKSTTARILPMLSSSETVKQLLEKPLKQFVLYRKKDGLVTKETFVVNEYVLSYLRHAKNGRFGRKVYGIGDVAKKEKQQLRDKLRRQERYRKKRMDLNLPVDENCQDTTDKVCSSCGRKGHIRTNQECPNFDKLSDLTTGNHMKSVPSSKSRTVVRSSFSSDDLSFNSDYRSMKKSEIQERKTSRVAFCQKSVAPHQEKSDFQKDEESLVNKKPKLLLSTNKSFENCTASQVYHDDDDEDDFIITIPDKQSIIKSCQKPIRTAPRLTRSRQRKKVVGKKVQFSACAAPFGDEPVIFQSQDATPTFQQPPTISSSDDESYNIEIDPECWKRIQNSKINEVKSSKNSCEIEEAEDWIADEKRTRNIGEKENIFDNFLQDMDCSNDGVDNGNVVFDVHDNEDDDDLIINFSDIIKSAPY